jgi:hypothetical protein
MSSDSQEIPPIRLDAELDRESARQIVEGVRDFASELRAADEGSSAPSKSEASKKLHVLVDQVLTLDLALPSGVKLGLLAIHGSHWKKPWEDLKKSLSQWKPQPEGRYERIIPAFGDMDEPSGFLETETDRNQRLTQAKAERQALAKIASDLDSALTMLTQLSQAAEFVLLGRTASSGDESKSLRPMSPKTIRQLNEKSFQIIDGSTTVEITGVNAKRVIDLLRLKRCHPMLLVADDSASRPNEEIDNIELAGAAGFGKATKPIHELTQKERSALIAYLTDAIQKFQDQLASMLPEEKEEKLKRDLKTHRGYLNSLNRTDAMPPRRARELAELSVKRVAEQLRAKGQEGLAANIEGWIEFDEARYEFIYTGPDWEFMKS